METTCNKCNAILSVGINWSHSCASRRKYICVSCIKEYSSSPRVRERRRQLSEKRKEAEARILGYPSYAALLANEKNVTVKVYRVRKAARKIAREKNRWDFERLKGEIFKPIPGAPDYHISNKGRVVGTRGLLKDQPHPVGYRIVGLRIDGRYKWKTVHSLVALTFLGPRPEGLDIAHKDHDKTNNDVRNLRYATRKENMADGHRADAKFRCAILDYDGIVNDYLRGGRTQRQIAEQYNCDLSSVTRIIREARKANRYPLPKYSRFGIPPKKAA